MPFLVRKITKAKWMQGDIFNDADISADAVTNCLKTTQNALSTWQISSEDELPEAVLAIVSNSDNCDKIDVVCLDRDSLESQGIRLEQSQGITPVEELKNRHVDISGLTYRSLGTVANEIAQEIRQKRDVKYTKNDIKKLLGDAIANGRLQKENLSESLRNKL
ncbi:MAG: hypothetical protein HQK59_07690 [Deltaproteobacteria bacterium]|nr:hypothetical protein [Deltaproteobacteria bacterium]MBF0523977.1 hypothetical protein [Deltaproteobacteria bacterium]